MIKEFAGEYSWLSNFTPVKVKLGGILFPSVEHAYVSAKSDSIEFKILCSKGDLTAGQVKRKGRQVPIPRDWGTRKLEIMTELLTQKFSQDLFRVLLLATGSQTIQEGNTWGDTFWGVELHTGDGENNLGKIIMEIRDQLRK